MELTKETILIVDDSRFHRTVIKELFSEHFHLLEAVSGLECMRIIEENAENIDLILLDLVMPGIDGFEILRLRQEIAAVSPKVLFAGTHVYSVEEKMENLMNDLNEAVPRVILSVLPFPVQSQLMREGRRYLNAAVWFAFRPEEILKKSRDTLTDRLRTRHSRRMLVRQLLQYEKTSTEA